MPTSDDLVRRWREAKLGERVGGHVLVSIECDGDPRAEVLAALDAARNERIERGVAFMDAPLVTMPAPEAQHTETVMTVAPNPPRRERKRGGKA